MKFNLNPGFKQFLIKTSVFIGLFILFSAIIGQKIVSSDLLYKFNIFIYGGMGYILLFSVLGFILLHKDRFGDFKKYRYELKQIIFLFFSALCLAGFYILELNVSLVDINFISILFVHLLFLSTFILLGLGVFGLGFINDFIKKFKKELIYFLIFGVVVYFLMNAVWSLWSYLSLVVLKIVYFLLKFISEDVAVIGSNTLIFDGFAAQIAEACSGIYSIFIFSSLYLFSIFLDWKKLNKLKILLVFVPAVLGAFLVNVLRVFLLMVAGAHMSREIALGLYHSYVGMIFFLIYFAVFWLLFYKWMKIKKEKKKENFIKKVYNHFMKDSLYRNSIFLMINTLIMAVCGFFFWIIAARFYPSEEVGLATALISLMSLITGLSVLGLNVGIIKYLPTAEDKDKKINTALTLVILSTIIVTSIFLVFSKYVSSKLVFVHDSLILSFIFLFFMIISSANSLIEGIFTAYRDTKFILIKNAIFSSLKLIFPFFLVFLGAYGIFSSWMISLFIGLLISFVILAIRFKYKPKFAAHDSIIKKIGKYSFSNYIAGFIGTLPSMIIPLVILNYLGAEQSAYYYMAMMIASLLFAIPQSTANSLFAEGSYDEEKLKHHISKSVKIISLLLIPAILVTIFFGQYVLLAFGKEYSREGFKFLQLLALGSCFVGINSVFGSIFRIKNRLKELVFRSILGSVLIIGLSYVLIQNGFGLLGVGYSWLIGQCAISISYFVLWFFSKKN